MPVILLALSWLPASGSETARKHLFEGDSAKAVELYRDALLDAKGTDQHRIAFGLGAAAFRAGDHDLAVDAFGTALATDNRDLQQNAYYNLGNTLIKRGEFLLEEAKAGAAIAEWNGAVKQFEKALAIGEHAEAAHNKALVEKWLQAIEDEAEEPEKENQEESISEDGEPQPDQSGSGNGEGKPGQGGEGTDGEAAEKNGKPEEAGPGGSDVSTETPEGSADEKPEPEEMEAMTPENLEGELKALSAAQDFADFAAEEAKSVAEIANPRTGYTPSEARRQLEMYHDEDEGVRLRGGFRMDGFRFKDW